MFSSPQKRRAALLRHFTTRKPLPPYYFLDTNILIYNESAQYKDKFPLLGPWLVDEMKGRLFVTEQVRHEYSIQGNKPLPSYVQYFPSGISDSLKEGCVTEILYALFDESQRPNVCSSCCCIPAFF
jgi:hypothetical protein